MVGECGHAMDRALTAPPTTIERWDTRADRDALTDAIEAVLFETSTTKSFTSTAERAAFRERWLGRYLEHDPSLVYVALLPHAGLSGYLVGCLEDPAVAPRFDDLAYFQAFAELTCAYPAHLHVNLTANSRNQGIGSALISAFARDAAQADASGMHVVTGRGMENVAFYLKNGFREEGAAAWNGKEILFLGRRLGLGRAMRDGDCQEAGGRVQSAGATNGEGQGADG